MKYYKGKTMKKNKWINEEALDVFTNYYYPRAAWLETNCNLGQNSYTSPVANTEVNDQLLQNVEIYDITKRRNAGFSNVLEDMWFKHNTPKWHTKTDARKDLIRSYDTSYWDLSTWLWIIITHRMTGSGASFLPISYGPEMEHGYCNNPVQYFGTMLDTKEMMDLMKERKVNKIPNFTSRGNQPAMCDNMDYIERYAPRLSQDLAKFLEVGSKKGHKEVVDFCNAFNKREGFKRFNFQFAAMSMDCSDYWPDLVDASSHTYIGNNAVKTKKLLSNGYTEAEFFDVLSDKTGGLAKDLEDCACDFQRFLEDYDAEKRGVYFNNSGFDASSIVSDRSGANRW